jgi:hypothetical protein
MEASGLKRMKELESEQPLSMWNLIEKSAEAVGEARGGRVFDP